MTSYDETTHQLKELLAQVEYVQGGSPEQKKKAKSDIQSEVRKYVFDEFQSLSDKIKRPSKEIRRFLYYNETILDSITELLQTSPSPVYAFDPESDISGGRPYDNGKLPLVRLLITQALLKKEQGKVTSAWYYLQAATKITDPLFARPELISQMLGLAVTRTIVLAIRKLPAPVPEWAFNWPNQNLEKGLLAAYSQEARNSMRSPNEIEIIPFLELLNTFSKDYGGKPQEITPVTKSIAMVAEKQYLRLVAYYRLCAIKDKIASRMNEKLCSRQPQKLKHTAEFLPQWVKSSAFYQATTFNGDDTDFLDNCWARFHFNKIQETGTKQILAIKSNLQPQKICDDLSWTIKEESTGRIVVSYDKQLPEGYDVFLTDINKLIFTMNDLK